MADFLLRLASLSVGGAAAIALLLAVERLTDLRYAAKWALLGHIRFTRYLRRWGSPITERETFDTLNEWKSALELRRAPRLLTCPGLETPMLAGLLRPRLLLPADAMDLPQLRHALLHELTHYKRRDIHFKLDGKLMRSKIGEDAAVAINEAFDVPVSTC